MRYAQWPEKPMIYWMSCEETPAPSSSLVQQAVAGIRYSWNAPIVIAVAVNKFGEVCGTG